MLKTHQHVSYLWDDAKAATLAGDEPREREVALFLYRSNLLGADLRLTNYGGGNTSVKITDTDPLTGQPVEVMWIKGSGGDIGTLKKSGCAALYVDRLLSLERVYRGIEHEDEMVELFNHCIFDLASKAPSIDTPLHGFLPFKHIDHLHPDAAIAIAAAKDGRRITEELFGGTIGWVDWQRPGFDLGLKLRACLDENAATGIKLRGIMLGSHGLFTWGDTSYDSYVNTLDVVETCAEYLEQHYGKDRPVFGGPVLESVPAEQRREQAAQLAPVLRGLCSSYARMIGHFTDDARVLEFTNSADLARLAPMGTSCPDHFLRTKIRPLVLDLAPDADLIDRSADARSADARSADARSADARSADARSADARSADAVTALQTDLTPAFDAYRAMYADYYNTCKHANSPAMRDPNPVVILWPGVGMFTFSKDKQTARVAAEFYINAINVMKGAEAISSYTSLPAQEAFDIEYWLLEEAKLQRMPKEKSLSRRVVMVTGSAGGIGKAIAKKFAEEGACVILNDNDADRLSGAETEFLTKFGKDAVTTAVVDVTSAASIQAAFKTGNLAFGGVDIVVNCAGLSISKTLLDHTERDWDLLYDVLVKGQFLVSQAGVAVMKKQGIGGDIINIASKNAVVAGPNNVGYGSAKAAQAHMTRLLAAELGPDKIRVNTVNPDAVISDSKIWAGAWAEGRAKAYGVTVEELPAFYAKRTLLNEIILPEDIANACLALVGGLLNKSTGNVLNVDGGVAMGFYR